MQYNERGLNFEIRTRATIGWYCSFRSEDKPRHFWEMEKKSSLALELSSVQIQYFELSESATTVLSKIFYENIR